MVYIKPEHLQQAVEVVTSRIYETHFGVRFQTERAVALTSNGPVNTWVSYFHPAATTGQASIADVQSTHTVETRNDVIAYAYLDQRIRLIVHEVLQMGMFGKVDW
jgi:hypothetical protein